MKYLRNKKYNPPLFAHIAVNLPIRSPFSGVKINVDDKCL